MSSHLTLSMPQPDLFASIPFPPWWAQGRKVCFRVQFHGEWDMKAGAHLCYWRQRVWPAYLGWGVRLSIMYKLHHYCFISASEAMSKTIHWFPNIVPPAGIQVSNTAPGETLRTSEHCLCGATIDRFFLGVPPAILFSEDVGIYSLSTSFQSTCCLLRSLWLSASELLLTSCIIDYHLLEVETFDILRSPMKSICSSCYHLNKGETWGRCRFRLKASIYWAMAVSLIQ